DRRPTRIAIGEGAVAGMDDARPIVSFDVELLRRVIVASVQQSDAADATRRSDLDVYPSGRSVGKVPLRSFVAVDGEGSGKGAIVGSRGLRSHCMRRPNKHEDDEQRRQ